MDGDGDVDLVFGSSASGSARLYANDGTGTFADTTPGHLNVQSSAELRTEDVDLDGDDDLFADGKLLINDGSGTFAQAPPEQFTGRPTGSLAIADADGDGLRDCSSRAASASRTVEGSTSGSATRGSTSSRN